MNARTVTTRIVVMLALVFVGFMAGRQTQRDIVALCYATAVNINRMIDSYDEVNVRIWDALGLLAPTTTVTPLGTQ